jgi:hypothetical protein
MNPADRMAANIESAELPGAVAGSDQKLAEQTSLDEFQNTSRQRRPVEDLHNLLLRVSHHLDHETSERATTYYRLLAIDGQTKTIISQTKRRALRAFARYVVAIFIGAAGILAWQSYGDATKQIIATKAPELGWSPEAKQMIASWIQQLGWTNLPAGPEKLAVWPSGPETLQPAPVAQVGSETTATKAAAAPLFDPEQVQQIVLGLASLQKIVGQIASSQDQMARDIAKLQADDLEIIGKIPAPPLQPAVAPAHKPMPVSPSSSRAPILPR